MGNGNGNTWERNVPTLFPERTFLVPGTVNGTPKAGSLCPSEFSKTPAVLKRFKDGSGDRTVFVVHGAAGWILSELSAYGDEDEVLLEPVCYFEVRACSVRRHAACAVQATVT